MPWKNSWFQLAAIVAVISGGLLIYDFGSGFYSSLLATKSAPSSPSSSTPLKPATAPSPVSAPVQPASAPISSAPRPAAAPANPALAARTAATINLDRVMTTYLEFKPELASTFKKVVAFENEYRSTAATKLQQVIEQQMLKEHGDVAGAQQKALQVKETSDKLVALKDQIAGLNRDHPELQAGVLSAQGEVSQKIASCAQGYKIDVVACGAGSVFGPTLAASVNVDLSNVPDLTNIVLAELTKTPLPILQFRKPAIIDSGKVFDNYYRNRILREYFGDNSLTFQKNSAEIGTLVGVALSDEVFKAIDDYAASHRLAVLNITPGGSAGVYPVVSKTAPNLVGVPDITDDIIALLNANQPASPTFTPPVTPPTPAEPTSTPPAATPSVPTPGPSASPTTGPVANQPWTNSLGMKFVPAGTDGVLFSIYDTRVKDFRAFVQATGHQSAGMDTYKLSTDANGKAAIVEQVDPNGGWQNPGFMQEPDHPVVCVSWDDANAFCEWLTKKEQAEGKIGANVQYRLPTDAEWSKAVGLNEGPGTPEEKMTADYNATKNTVLLWGSQWPPPSGAGNFAGEEVKSTYPRLGSIAGYDDGYVNTSPVGSFSPSTYGLYDMEGNVYQWCEDAYSQSQRVLRGSSWNSGGFGVQDAALRMRGRDFPTTRSLSNGFRMVIVTSL